MMRTPGEWLLKEGRKPGGTQRYLVIAIVVAAGVAALVRLPHELRDLRANARAVGSLSYADRDVGAGNSIVPEQVALYQFAGRIPLDATYRVIVGPAQDGWTERTATSIEPFVRYWLMPRRSAADAGWIVCVGCDPAEYPGAVEEWSGEAGIRLLRIGR